MSANLNWNEFINKLKFLKKEKKTKGISVPTIANMIFAGAMDEMIDGSKSVEKYKEMYKQVTSALGSKANLAKKRKTEMIGLADVNGPVSLALWRNQVDPTSIFDFISICKDSIKPYGFIETNHKEYPLKRKPNNDSKIPALMTPYWGNVFKNKQAIAAFSSREYDLVIMGLITDVAVKKYDNNQKERLCFKIFTGVEQTDEIVVWPDTTGRIPDYIKNTIKPMELGFASVRPKVWNGKAGASLIKWQKIIRD